jgi:DNA-binding HxlR family transcriptional regulator
MAIAETQVASPSYCRDAGSVRDYAQYCPVARSSELLAERWTPIIVRNLLNGCRTFNAIRQGAPGNLDRPSRTATRRPRTARCPQSTPNETGRGGIYRLTEMGQDLRGVCDAMGQWGARWLEFEPAHGLALGRVGSQILMYQRDRHCPFADR